MSIYDKASLVLIPSGSKTSKVYSQKPTNGDGDFTFSRSTAATRVNASGNIEKETQNLLKYSNTFSNAIWQGTATWTSGQTDRDGGTSAWLFAKTTPTSSDNYGESFTGLHTFSIYVKKEAGKGIAIYNFFGGTNARAIYNVETGALQEQNPNVVDSNLVAYNSNWWRLDVSVNLTSAGIWYIYATDGTTTLSTDTLVLQDAQLEQGLVARDYIETTTTAIYGGITDNVPRLDYTDSSCPALLLEPQRTNLLENSEYLIEGSSGWTQEGSPDPSISLEEVTTPDGGSVAYKHTANATNSRLQNSLGSLGADHTYSIFVKGTGVATRFRLRNNNGNDVSYDIDANGDFTYNGGSATSYDIEDYENGWKRIWMVTTTSSSSTNFIQIYTDSDNGSGSVYVWGAQVEEGSYPTSYIPTYGSAVTRNLDNTSLTGVSDLLGQTEGTIYSEVRFPQEGNASNWLSISAGNVRNWVFIGKDGDDIRGYVRANNSVIFSNQTFQIVDNALAKVAIAYKSGDIVLYINGTQISSSSTDFTFDVTLDRVYFGSYDNGNTYETRKQNQVLLFKTRLSNEELATLTTI